MHLFILRIELSENSDRPTCLFSMTFVIWACSAALKFEKSMYTFARTRRSATVARSCDAWLALCGKTKYLHTSQNMIYPHCPSFSDPKFSSVSSFTFCKISNSSLPPSVSDLNMAMSFREALARLENSRVKSTRPLIPPQILQEDLPL